MGRPELSRSAPEKSQRSRGQSVARLSTRRSVSKSDVIELAMNSREAEPRGSSSAEPHDAHVQEMATRADLAAHHEIAKFLEILSVLGRNGPALRGFHLAGPRTPTYAGRPKGDGPPSKPPILPSVSRGASPGSSSSHWCSPRSSAPRAPSWGSSSG